MIFMYTRLKQLIKMYVHRSLLQSSILDSRGIRSRVTGKNRPLEILFLQPLIVHFSSIYCELYRGTKKTTLLFAVIIAAVKVLTSIAFLKDAFCWLKVYVLW